MHIVFHIVEAQGKRQLKGNWKAPEFRCEMDTPGQPLSKGMFLPKTQVLSGAPSLPT